MAAVPVTLLDLDNECLHHILDSLDGFDFTNLAEAFDITVEAIEKLEKIDDDTENLTKSKYVRFAKAVRNMFAQKYSDVCINRYDRTNHYKQYPKLLHHFGDLVGHLLINNSLRSLKIELEESRMEVIEEAVLKHCHESLVSMFLFSIDKASFSTICEPFTNVENLNLLRNIPNSFLPLNKWFPNLRSLNLYSMVFAEPECIECYFPNLEELSISNSIISPVFTESNLAIALHLNNQLTTLNLRHDREDDIPHSGIRLNAQFIHFIQRKLPNLSDLTVDITESSVVNLPFEDWIEMKCLSSLTIKSLSWYQLKRTVPIKSSELKKVCIESKSWNSIEREDFEYLINFAKNNNNIDELKLVFTMEDYYNDFHSDEHDYDLLSEFWVDLVDALPKLKYITIPHNWRNHSAEIIVRMLHNNKSINRFTCQQFSTDEDDDGNEVHDFELEKQRFECRFRQYAEKYGYDTSLWHMKFTKHYYEDVILSRITDAPESSSA